MPQIFQVIRCYKCLVFQVHQTKKSNKWECKLCGEKQSVKRHYGIGTAKDCRMHVQKLNSMRGEKDELKCDPELQIQESDNSDEIDTVEHKKVSYQSKADIKSKWANYMEEKASVGDVDNEPVYLGDVEVVLELPKKRKKLFNVPKSNPITTTATQNVDHSIENSIKKTYKPCHKTAQKGSFDTVDIKPIQGISSEFIQPDISSKTIIEEENSKTNLIKNSKWAEYIEAEVDNELDFSASQNDLMFSQCDDSELDSILDI